MLIYKIPRCFTWRSTCVSPQGWCEYGYTCHIFIGLRHYDNWQVFCWTFDGKFDDGTYLLLKQNSGTFGIISWVVPPSVKGWWSPPVQFSLQQRFFFLVLFLLCFENTFQFFAFQFTKWNFFYGPTNNTFSNVVQDENT